MEIDALPFVLHFLEGLSGGIVEIVTYTNITLSYIFLVSFILLNLYFTKISILYIYIYIYIYIYNALAPCNYQQHVLKVTCTNILAHCLGYDIQLYLMVRFQFWHSGKFGTQIFALNNP